MGDSSSEDAVVFDSRTGVRLELRPAPRPYDHGRHELPTWQAILVGDGLDCSVVCPEQDWQPRSLAEVLESISEDWQGWKGERGWHSEEMSLTFRHEKANTILMAVVLEDVNPRWRCEAELELSPGVFSYLASEVRRLGAASLAL